MKSMNWLRAAPGRALVMGIVIAVTLAAVLMWQVMQAPMAEIRTLISTLSITSLISLGLGYGLYRRGWTRSPSLMVTLLMTYVWAAVLTFVNVWVMAEQMFASQHDLLLASILLTFAAVIAMSFGVFVSASISDSLCQLDETAVQIADGDLHARVSINGRDEVARVSQSFNEMAVKLQEAEKQRQELEELRRDLIAWTSHDLRTPLTSVRAMVEALSDGVVEDPEMVQRYYRTIRADVIALNDLINDLFELAQLDAGGMEFELSEDSLSDLISDALESFHLLGKKRDISVRGEVEGEVVVKMNAQKINRVLGNLLSNALRYTPDGGSVCVRVAETGKYVQVSVQDSGPGFNPDDLERVFEKFYRGEQARSRATGGAGLGLAIAAGIVDGHNGRIWADNAPEGGAVVTFELPDIH